MRTSLKLGESEISVLDIPAGGAPLRKICRTVVPTVELVLPLESAVVVRSEDRDERVVRADEAMYLVGRRRYSVYTSNRSFALAVAVPASVVEDYTPGEGEVGSIRDSTVLAPVKRFLVGVMEQHDELERLSAYLVEKLLWEMVASLMLESRGAASLARPSLGFLDRAMAHIAAYRTDPSLSPVALAATLNISTRQLQRVFSAVGTTPSREIRRQRADLALSLLQNEAFRVLNISQIAHHSGFTDAADLRRAFDALGYPPPSEVRGGQRR
jgi:AraC-like DNA-binding protein